MFALQGLEAAQYMRGLAPFDLRRLTFGDCAFVPIEGFNLHVVRGGYTGEDGSEVRSDAVSPPLHHVDVAQLLSKPPMQPTGLGAHDSLRLEVGICLYSQDLKEDMPPIEDALAWVIGKNRCDYGTSIGTEGVRKHLKEGPPWRQVGMIVKSAPARRFSRSGFNNAQVMSIIFSIGKGRKALLRWSDFIKAMQSIGFSVDNTRINGKSGKSGSKRVFTPPEKVSEPGKALIPFSWDKVLYQYPTRHVDPVRQSHQRALD
ncbi:hypothetical protein ACG7TL_006779 [Trametes sanguinea]